MLIQQECQFLPPIEDDKILACIFKPYHSFSNTYHNQKVPHYGSSRELKNFTYCNKIGHTIEVCFKKHILPPYLKKSSTNDTSSFFDNPTNATEAELEELALNHGYTTFTIDYHKALLALLEQSSPTNTA